MNLLQQSKPGTAEVVSTDPRQATLSAAFAETAVIREADARLALQLREALAMVEVNRERGNLPAAWYHLRMAGKILAQIGPEPQP